MTAATFAFIFAASRHRWDAVAPRSLVHNARINIALIALTAAAAILIAAAFLCRGRLSWVLLSAGLFSVLAVLAIEINAPWMTASDTWVWTWFNAHRSPNWQVDADGIFSYIG